LDLSLFFKKYFKTEKKLFIKAFILIFISSLAGIVYGYLMGLAIDKASLGLFMDSSIVLIIYFVLGILDNMIFDRLGRIYIEQISINMMEKIGFEVYTKVGVLPARAFEEKSSGELINRITNDSQTITETFKSLLRTIVALWTALVVLIYICFNSLIVTFEILIYIFLFYLFSKKYLPKIKENQKAEVENAVEQDDQTYTLDKMMIFIKKRLDEITKVNLYDIGLSEEELKRRKNKKYELKKALKGCTYGDVNDKKYIKELIYDLLSKEYGVTETNISKAIPFDIPSLLTGQDKFDVIIHEYQKEFGYEALGEMIKKYNLDTMKYIQGESKPCYVITSEEIDQIYEKENLNLSFADKLEVVVQRIYQQYKGYSSIDEVRDMNIDGVSGRSIWSTRKLFEPSCTNRW